MKLLFLNTNVGYGGASKMLVWVANQCALAGHDVTLLTYRDSTINQHICSSVKHVHQQLEDINGKGNIFNSIIWLRKYVNTECFDVAVAFLSSSQLRLYFACLGTNIKTLFSHRGDPYTKHTTLKQKFVGAISNILFRQADAYVFQTQQAKDFFCQINQKHSIVIPNPVNPLKRTCVRKNSIQKRIVCIGRLQIWQKRQDILINAFNQISHQYPDYILEFYGDGADEQILKSMAQDNPRIYFRGKTNNVAEAIQNAAMFVLSSDFEGIPNALLEAMSLGLPCISTDCSPGGAALLIQNNKNGILTKRGDANELARAMKYFLENPEEAESMGKEALKVIDTYSEEKIKNLWLNFLEKMVE